MGDSDEEFDRRRNRDKFRRERNDYDRGGRREGFVDNRMRDDWNRRGPPMGRYDDRRRFSPPSPRHDLSPPHMKRMRRDWDDGGYGPEPHWEGGHKLPEPDYPTQPPMQTFKQFLQVQDDSISDDDAVKKYADYKQDFKKQQISEFFLAHKDEEWFKAKYHPDECEKKKVAHNNAIKHRCNVFMQLFENNWLENFEMDCEKQSDIVKLLDAAVILMEGGDLNDLSVLDLPECEIDQREEMKIEKEKIKDDNEDTNTEKIDNLKRKTSENMDDEQNSNSGISSSSLSNSEDDDDEPNENKKKSSKEKNKQIASNGKSSILNPKEADDNNESFGDVDNKKIEKNDEEKKDDLNEKEKNIDEKESIDEKQEVENSEKISDDQNPRPFHKTLSIFLRNLAPAITKQEVEAMCKRYNGFMRVAIQDPQPERRFHRRGWVTFNRSVNIKDICWNLNNIRLRDCDMGAIVNRDLKQRVRPINGIVSHKQIARMDIRHAARIVAVMDKRVGLWQKEKSEKNVEKKNSAEADLGLNSNNPLLKNITDYMVEEADCEEEELLGMVGDSEDKNKDNSSTKVEKDDGLNKVLDRLLLYLRIVHSFDYYSVVEYPNEDEMPHRCGILHARGSAPINMNVHAFNTAVNDWIANFEQKVLPWVNLKLTLSDEEAERLGKKSEEAEIEKFILDNTQEVAKDKWLCPLSGKKFKGPDYIRKHILNKHEDKVEDVKKEVVFFNNYLLDPKRPQLPEHPSRSSGGGGGPGMAHLMGGPPRMDYHHQNHFGRPPNYGASYERNRGGYGFQGMRDFRDRRMMPPPMAHRMMSNRGRMDPRPMIDYNDLDAPADMDII